MSDWYGFDFDPGDADRTFVVFLDSLGPKDLDNMDFFGSEFDRGDMVAGIPRVTPKVLGEIYTGVDPANNGLPAVSRYDTDPRHRPAQYTLPEMGAMSDKYDRVLQFHLPFIIEPRVMPDEDFWTISGAMGQQNLGPAQAQGHLQVPGPAGDLRQDDPDIVFNAMHDYCRQVFEQARTLAEAQDFDLVFISFRGLDSYTHWRRTLEYPVDIEGCEYYRDALIKECDEQLYETAKHGHVFVFGDHGSEPLKETFRINRWLIENEFLDVQVDWDWIDQAEEYGIIAAEEHPADEAVPNQISWEQPGVAILGESEAICADPFSTGITIHEGTSDERVDELVDALMATGYFEAVHRTDDLWDADGLYRDECPDLYPERKPGVYVTGNLHPYPVGVGYMRSGVHGQYGAWASTKPLPEWANETITPIELHHVIRDAFLEVGEYQPLKADLDTLTPTERDRVIDYLHDQADEKPVLPDTEPDTETIETEA